MNKRLKQLRKKLNLTQMDFAGKIGSSQNMLSGYELGRCKPSSVVIKEGLIKSTCLDWREKFSLVKAKNRRNTLCISRFFNADGRKFFRQDRCGDLFSASLTIFAKPLASMNIGLEPAKAKCLPPGQRMTKFLPI